MWRVHFPCISSFPSVPLEWLSYMYYLTCIFESGSIWRSFPNRDHLRSWDHLGTRTVHCATFYQSALRHEQREDFLLAQSHNTPLSPPQKNCVGIVLDFSWDIFTSQEKLQTMIMQNFWG